MKRSTSFATWLGVAAACMTCSGTAQARVGPERALIDDPPPGPAEPLPDDAPNDPAPEPPDAPESPGADASDPPGESQADVTPPAPEAPPADGPPVRSFDVVEEAPQSPPPKASAPPPTPPPATAAAPPPVTPAAAAVAPAVAPATSSPAPYAPPEPKPKYGADKWTYLLAEVGFLTANLQNAAGQFYAVERNQAAGVVFGGSLGLRLGPFTLGGHARYAPMDNFDYLSLGGDLGLRLGIERVDVVLQAGGGYLQTNRILVAMAPDVSTINDPATLQAALAVQPQRIDGQGGNLGGAAGVDVFLFDHLTVGARVGGEVLFIALPLGDILSSSTSQEQLANTLVGSSFSVTATVGGHL